LAVGSPELYQVPHEPVADPWGQHPKGAWENLRDVKREGKLYDYPDIVICMGVGELVYKCVGLVEFMYRGREKNTQPLNRNRAKRFDVILGPHPKEGNERGKGRYDG
jgi:hypothetical protein